jgi:hypothetical protein
MAAVGQHPIQPTGFSARYPVCDSAIGSRLMLRMPQTSKATDSLMVRYRRTPGDYAILRYRVSPKPEARSSSGAKTPAKPGQALTMPDAARSMESLLTDLIDAADRFAQRPLSGCTAATSTPRRRSGPLTPGDELVALHATREPSIVVLEL